MQGGRARRETGALAARVGRWGYTTPPRWDAPLGWCGPRRRHATPPCGSFLTRRRAQLFFIQRASTDAARTASISFAIFSNDFTLTRWP